jgi:hypothetical protein
MKLSVILCIATTVACTNQQAKSADTYAIDLTGAICAEADSQPVGQPWVAIVCTGAQVIEQVGGQVISALGPDGGSSATVQSKTIKLTLPKDAAPAFLAAHSRK